MSYRYVNNPYMQLLAMVIKTKDWSLIEDNGLTLKHFNGDEVAKSMFEYYEKYGKVITNIDLHFGSILIDAINPFLEYKMEDFSPIEDIVENIKINHFYLTEFCPMANKCVEYSDTEPLKAMEEFSTFALEHQDVIFGEKSVKSEDYANDFLSRVFDNDSKVPPMTTGIASYDKVLDGGYYPGTVNLLASIPGGGKTTLATQSATINAKNGTAVLFLSLEMPKDYLFNKIFARECYVQKSKNIPVNKFNVNKEVNFSEDEVNTIKSLDMSFLSNLTILDSTDLGGTGLDDIKTEISKFCHKHHKQPILIIVDYVQEITVDKYEQERSKVTLAAREIRTLAQKFNSSVLLISSMNRESYRDYSKPITKNALKDSGDLEYCATTITVIESAYVGNKDHLYQWD